MALSSTRGQASHVIARSENQATLRTIMTSPPMSAAVHAATAHTRTADRCRAEKARDRWEIPVDDWTR